MGENSELQDEELEVLKSIYEGDENYSSQSNTKHAYKYGEDLKSRSFLLEISWPDEYPSILPEISLDSFYNKHLLPEENFDSLMEKQPATIEVVSEKIEKIQLDDEQEDGSKDSKKKKEQLTKSQKRRMWDKGGAEEDRTRGWDWVDVVKHLHQTGGKEDEQL